MYTIEIPIVSLSTNWRFKPITTLHQKELCKVLFEEDNYILFNTVINEILSQCTHPLYNINQLNIIDKLIVLLRLRSASMGSTIDIILQNNNKKINLCYNFNDILQNIYNTYKNIEAFIINKNNIKITCYVPYIRWENDIIKNNLINYYIKDLVILGNNTNFADRTIEEQNNILNNLPANILQKINLYIQEINKKFADVFLYKALEDTLPLYMYGETIFEYLKFIFKEDLNNIYQDIYSLNTHLHFESNYIENLSPIEREMYITMFKKENNRQSSTTNIPIPQQEQDYSNPSLLDSLDMYKNIKGG